MFHTVVEMHSRNQWLVHSNVADSVDALLAGNPAQAQLRQYMNGIILIKMHNPLEQEAFTKPCCDADSWIQDLYRIQQTQVKSEDDQ